jgi:hypothetical protein
MTEPNDADDRSELQAAGPSSLRRNGLPQELKDSWEPGPGYADTLGAVLQRAISAHEGDSLDQLQADGFRRQRGPATLGPARGAARSSRSRARQRSRELAPSPSGDCDRRGAVQFVAHAACLGCQWIDQPGTSMEEPGWREAAAAVARRHESSHGEFRGQPDQ